MRHRFYLLALFWALTSAARAGDDIDFLYTAGTVTQNAAGQSWAYVAWQSTGEGVPRGPFSIHAKPGGPDSAADFSRVAIVEPLYDPAVIRSVLSRARNLGEDLDALEETARRLFLDVLPDGGFELEELLSVVFYSAENDPELFETLTLFARMHPAVALCLGWGYAMPLPAGETTIELRRHDLSSGADTSVVGRVTLDPAVDYRLPAPGPGVDRTLTDSRGHLNVRLLWGTDADLRRLAPLHYGFNIYRLDRSLAEELDLDDGDTPDIGLFPGIVGKDDRARRVNRLPALAAEEFTEAQAAAAASSPDDDLFFFADDNDRFNEGEPFNDGDQFLYFITARDILGRDGHSSPGTLVTVCDRMPPPVPTRLEARNRRVGSGASATGALEISWQQNPDIPANPGDTPTTGYYIYRWRSVAEMNENAHDFHRGIVGFVPHVEGRERAVFVDDGPGAPTVEEDAGFTFLYTVRAEDSTACGDHGNISGNSAPVPAVLRDWSGPDAPTGSVSALCGSVLIEPFTFPPGEEPDLSLEDERALNYFHWLIAILIVDPMIIWYEVGTGLTEEEARASVQRHYVRPDREGADFFPPQYYYVQKPRAAFDLKQDNLYYVIRAGAKSGAVSERVSGMVGLPQDFDSVELIPYEIDHLWVKGGVDGPCFQHVSRNPAPEPGQPDIQPLEITFVMPHDAVEWKLFRRINDGPLTLVGQDADRSLAGETVTTEDAALPGAPSTRICYFLQAFNANGMSSSLVRLDCFDVAHSGFQRPLLTPLTPLADAGDGQRRARLRFFAPAAGTERFEIWVGALPDITPDAISGELSPDISNGGVIPALEGLEDFGDRTFRVFETPRLGGSFGASAPDFEIEIELPAGADYAFAVRPVGRGPWAPPGDEAGAARLAGPFSNIETFRWHAPEDEDPDQVPWPALDTPPVHNDFHPMADARVLPAGFGGGVGFRIGEFTLDPFIDAVLNQQPDNTPPHINFYPADIELNQVFYQASESNFLLSPASERMRSLLPGVLYRYQIDGPLGTVSDRIVQVSPLAPADIQSFLFSLPVSDRTIEFRQILDTFVQAVRDDDDDFVGAPRYGLYLLDTMPVAAGSTYGYLLVLFDDDGEINRVVPSQPVQIQ
ncbi:MAG: hypothetical protein JJT96_08695 [Opitutales bacterium]|nr:hypothetical protein [Opitutales bacterium]